MGLQINLNVSGLSPENFKRMFGVPFQMAEVMPGGAEGLVQASIQSEFVIWTCHPELVDEGSCPLCLSYEGIVFPRDDPSMPAPPLHCYCMCELSPFFEEGNPLLEGRLPKPPMKRFQALEEKLRELTEKEREDMIGVRLTRILQVGRLKPIGKSLKRFFRS